MMKKKKKNENTRADDGGFFWSSSGIPSARPGTTRRRCATGRGYKGHLMRAPYDAHRGACHESSWWRFPELLVGFR